MSKKNSKSSKQSSGNQTTLHSFGYSAQIRTEEQIRNELSDVEIEIIKK
jgi:hypothetical protein